MEVREKISWPQRFHGIFPMYEINTSLFKHFRTRNLTPETEMVWATTAPLGTHTLTFILERVTKLNETNRYSKEFLSVFVSSKCFCIFTRQFISTGYSFLDRLRNFLHKFTSGSSRNAQFGILKNPRYAKIALVGL